MKSTGMLLRGAVYILAGALIATLGMRFLGAITVLFCIIEIVLTAYRLHKGTVDRETASLRLIVFAALGVLTALLFDHLHFVLGAVLVTLGLVSLLGFGEVASRIHDGAGVCLIAAVALVVIGAATIVWFDAQYVVTILGGTALVLLGLYHLTFSSSSSDN